MSMSRLTALGLGALLMSTAGADEGPGLGEPLVAERIAEIDYVVMPDGSGLPDGAGTAAAGAAIYGRHCVACHGANGSDGINDALVGGHGSIDGESPVKTVGSYWPYATTLFDYIRRAMPYQQPGSLSPDEVYSLTAYILYLNGIVAEAERVDADSLAGIRMPNRDNFVWADDALKRDAIATKSEN